MGAPKPYIDRRGHFWGFVIAELIVLSVGLAILLPASCCFPGCSMGFMILIFIMFSVWDNYSTTKYDYPTGKKYPPPPPKMPPEIEV